VGLGMLRKNMAFFVGGGVCIREFFKGKSGFIKGKSGFLMKNGSGIIFKV
jgi:hypothetical protein